MLCTWQACVTDVTGGPAPQFGNMVLYSAVDSSIHAWYLANHDSKVTLAADLTALVSRVVP